MPKKIIIWILLIFGLYTLFFYRIYDLAVKNKDIYLQKAREIKEVYVTGTSAPRGRILDINGNILVDNKGINMIYYHKNSNITLSEELSIAETLVLLTDYQYKYDEAKLKEFYLLKYPLEGEKLITEEEKELYKERKISKSDIENLKLDRVTKKMIDTLTPLEKYSSTFYYLMNDGYSYENKCVLSNISDKVYALVLEAKLPGIFGEISWERTYPYNETLKTILGSISTTLPKEKSFLLNMGYTYQDKVGISGLEEYYETYLKGEKALYKVGENNELILVKEANRGSDIVLNIDINMQLEIEKIMKEEIIKAKKNANTEFYKGSYALVSEPATGNIKAIAGVRLITNQKDISFQDTSIEVIKNAYTVGSAIKGASISVGYKYNIIDIGTNMTDSCIKLANMPAKCSYKRLGTLNDIEALALSSNYYQFIIAIRIMGYNYTYNMDIKATKQNFDIYRNVFLEYGLGAKTGIDLPEESTGLKGSTVAPDLLLNLAIGQYDLYTPVQLLQYISTIANNGNRLKLNIVNHIIKDNKVIYKNETKVLNKVNLDEKYIKRIQLGFNSVIKSGTGYYYINPKINAAGKTGTSESWIDSDYDKTLDSYVLSNTFLMYAPFDNPKYSMVVISPNTSNLMKKSTYRSPVNRLIARRINDFLFSS